MIKGPAAYTCCRPLRKNRSFRRFCSLLRQELAGAVAVGDSTSDGEAEHIHGVVGAAVEGAGVVAHGEQALDGIAFLVEHHVVGVHDDTAHGKRAAPAADDDTERRRFERLHVLRVLWIRLMYYWR